VLIGIVAQAVAFIVWTPDLLDESYVVGAKLIDPLWVLGLVAIGAGGAITAHSPAAATAAEREPGRFGGVLPAGVFVLLVAALVQAQFEHPPVASRLALAAGLLTCGAMLIGRGVLLSRNLRLLLDRERTAREELAGREVELARLNRRLAEDSRRDPLTGLLNRRALAADLAAQRDDGAPLAVALLDVDRFKPYNDRLGHLAGDQALRSLAGIVNRTLRAGDDAYRYGGEELLLVMRGAGADDAVAAAERVRAAVAAAALPHPDGIGGILTVSIGVASGGAGASGLLARADAALYEAKAAGRDRVVGARDAEPVRRPLHRAPSSVEEPVLRHLRSVLAVARAGAAGRGMLAVADALAHAIRAELRFETVVVNLRDRATDELHAALVVGDEDARAALEGTRSPWSAWAPALRPEHERCGAIWLPAGSEDPMPGVATWTPPPTGAVAPDAWDAEDMLLLPLRASSGEVLGVVSVDQPLSGRRPDDGEIAVLMAVADHAALALEQLSNATPRLPQPHSNVRHASSHREPRIHRH
jgi:diguanylate cyclase (GGDEF)-like protein